MASRLIDYSDLPVIRNLTLCVSDPSLHAALPFSILTPGISDDAMWLLDGETPFGFRIKRISDAYPFISEFRPGQSVLYLYSKRKGEGKGETPFQTPLHPDQFKIRNVQIHIASGDRVGKELKRQGVEFVEQQLDYGDVAFTVDGKLIELAIERKAKSDLSSSITDGRLKTQTKVMTLNVEDHSKIVYFIEGDPIQTQFGPNDKAKLASVVYPMMRKNTSTVIGEDIEATARFITNIHHLLETVPEKKLEDKGMVRGRELNNGVKKSDLLEENKFRRIVALVPHIGDKIEDVIVSHFATFSDMREAFIRDGECAIEKLSMLEAGSEPGVKGQRQFVGPAASKKVYEYFEFENLRGAKVGQKRELEAGAGERDKKKKK